MGKVGSDEGEAYRELARSTDDVDKVGMAGGAQRALQKQSRASATGRACLMFCSCWRLRRFHV